MSASAAIADEIVYPETDGKPMSDNTFQLEWMFFLFGNFEDLFANDPNVFAACNLFWYPIEGDNKTRLAPHVSVAFGRPKGHRSSYLQWREAGIPPTVVFEVYSPSQTQTEVEEKFRFYERFGVEEYFIYDPDSVALHGFQRNGDQLVAIREMNDFVSPRLQVRFDLSGDKLVVWRPDYMPFLTFSELLRMTQEEYQCLWGEAGFRKANADYKKANAEFKKAHAEAEAERKEYESLLAKLKAHGIDPEKL